MSGITVVVVILVPIAYQVFMLRIKEAQRDKEIRIILKRIEDKISNGK